MPRAPFPRELYRWLYNHVEAGDISRETAHELWSVAHNDFPGVLYYPRRKGRPGASGGAIAIPGLDEDHNNCFGHVIIKQYLIKNPPQSPLVLARFATILKDSGCWAKSIGADGQSRYEPIKSMHRTLASIIKDMGLAHIHYEPFTQALRDIEEGLGESYPNDLRQTDAIDFKNYLAIAVKETESKELPDDYWII